MILLLQTQATKAQIALGGIASNLPTDGPSQCAAMADCCELQVPGGPKSDTPFNYVDIMPDKLQNTRYLHCLNNFKHLLLIICSVSPREDSKSNSVHHWLIQQS